MSAPPTVVDVAVNPNDPPQRYVPWGNGRVDAHGGALPITDGPTFYDRYDQPIVVAIHVLDWDGPSGYMLDVFGAFHPFGDVPEITTRSGDTWVNSNGLPYVPERRYVAWSWNPDGSGQGYAVDYWGELYEFGGAPDPVRYGRRFAAPAVKGFLMQWTPDKRGYLLDLHGGIHPEWNAVAPDPATHPYYPRHDVARDSAITNWTTGAGYLLTSDGAVHPFGGAPSSLYGGPYRPGADVARTLNVLSVSDPTEFLQVWSGGQVIQYVASDPPTVTAGGSLVVSPAATVTTTTRPVLSWDYSDPQADSQAAWELYVFTQAFVDGHSMTDPTVHAASALVAESGINPGARGVTSPIDLANGSYRMYVRAKDTAGQWSAWDDHGWTQNIATPATPTGLTATADNATFTVTLVATSPGTAPLLRFDYSDDPDAATSPNAVTWTPVDGADALPRSATTTGIDRAAPLGVTRTYRPVAYSVDPRVASLPGPTATATLTSLAHVLTAQDDSTLGGRIRVQEPYEWVRPLVTGVFQGLGGSAAGEPRVRSDYPTVLKEGRPKAARGTLRLLSTDAATWDVIEALAESASTLVYRDPFGNVRYCEVVGEWPQRQVRAAPTADEVTPLRHMHTTDLQLVEVAPPSVAR